MHRPSDSSFLLFLFFLELVVAYAWVVLISAVIVDVLYIVIGNVAYDYIIALVESSAPQRYSSRVTISWFYDRNGVTIGRA